MEFQEKLKDINKICSQISALATEANFRGRNVLEGSETLMNWLMNGGQVNMTFDVLQLIFSLLDGGNIDDFTEKIIKKLSDKLLNASGIAKIEVVVKDALLAAMTSLLSCSADPILPDKLIDSGANKSIAGEGYTFPLSNIDLVGKLYTSPCDKIGRYLYFDVINVTKDEVNAAEMWKSRDMDAFLWFVINGEEFSGNKRNKCTWDNRYTLQAMGKDGRQTFIPDSDVSTNLYGGYEDDFYDGTNGDRKKIMRVQYQEGNSLGEGYLKVLVDPDNYYRTRTISNIKPISGAVSTLLSGAGQSTIETVNKIGINKFFLEWDYDYIQSIKLFDVKNILSQLILELGHLSLSINVKFSRSKLLLEQIVNQVIKNIVASDDTEVDDCYYSFSNDEYNTMLEKAELIRKNMLNGTGEQDAADLLSSLDTVSDSATINHDTSTITNMLTMYQKKSSGNKETNGGIQVSWLLGKVLKNIAWPFIECIFTPKVMLLIAINMEFIGKDPKANWNNILTTLMNIVTQVIVKIKDMIVEILMSWVISELTKLVEKVLAMRIMEKINDYKEILERLFAFYQQFLKSQSNKGTLDMVNYADITEQSITTPETTKC